MRANLPSEAGWNENYDERQSLNSYERIKTGPSFIRKASLML